MTDLDVVGLLVIVFLIACILIIVKGWRKKRVKYALKTVGNDIVRLVSIIVLIYIPLAGTVLTPSIRSWAQNPTISTDSPLMAFIVKGAPMVWLFGTFIFYWFALTQLIKLDILKYSEQEKTWRIEEEQKYNKRLLSFKRFLHLSKS